MNILNIKLKHIYDTEEYYLNIRLRQFTYNPFITKIENCGEFKDRLINHDLFKLKL